MIFAPGSSRDDLPRGLQTIDVGHPDVHQDQVGSQDACCGDRLGSIGRLTDHLQVGLTVDHHAKAQPHEFLIVDDEDLGRHRRDPAGVYSDSVTRIGVAWAWSWFSALWPA